jgi:hypothetical protein
VTPSEIHRIQNADGEHSGAVPEEWAKCKAFHLVSIATFLMNNDRLLIKAVSRLLNIVNSMGSFQKKTIKR